MLFFSSLAFHKPSHRTGPHQELTLRPHVEVSFHWPTCVMMCAKPGWRQMPPFAFSCALDWFLLGLLVWTNPSRHWIRWNLLSAGGADGWPCYHPLCQASLFSTTLGSGLVYLWIQIVIPHFRGNMGFLVWNIPLWICNIQISCAFSVHTHTYVCLCVCESIKELSYTVIIIIM